MQHILPFVLVLPWESFLKLVESLLNAHVLNLIVFAGV